MLLAAGADPSVVSDSGNIGNPLGWTAYVGDLRCVKMRANKHDQCLELLVELDEIQQLPKGRRDDILGPRAEFLHLLRSDDGQGLDALIRKRPELVDRDLVRNELFHHATGNHQGKVDRKPWLAAVEVLVKHGVPWTTRCAICSTRTGRRR